MQKNWKEMILHRKRCGKRVHMLAKDGKKK
jgi:hypothetical protein